MICPHCGHSFIRRYRTPAQNQIINVLRCEGYPMTSMEIQARMAQPRGHSFVPTVLRTMEDRGLVFSVPAGLKGRGQARVRLWALYPEDVP